MGAVRRTNILYGSSRGWVRHVHVFLLSAYLITELLLKEKVSTGSIHVKAFYIRRILRIWPLYFAAIIGGGAIGHFIPHYYNDHARVFCFLLLSANIFIAVKGQLLTPIAHLWSISVEEQFYLLWPSLAKLGGPRLLRSLSIALLPVSLFTTFLLATHNPVPFSIWVNSFVQFLFFAIGALLSLFPLKPNSQATMINRLAKFMLGALLWMLAIHTGFLEDFPTRNSALRESAGYGLAAVGCIFIFWACLDMPKKWIPRQLVYLGKISYGLYVFHLSFLLLAYSYAPQHVNQWLGMICMNASVLAVTIAVSMFSYHCFEKPFLLFKKRFEFVHSRVV